MYSRKPVKTGNWKSSKIWRAALQCNVTRSAVGRDVVSTSHYIFNIFSIYIYVYYIFPYISYDFYTFYTRFIPTGPLQDLQVASRPRDHCLATSRGSLIDVERGLVQWRVELDQAKAGPFCDMMSPLTFFRILKGLKVHFKSK